MNKKLGLFLAGLLATQCCYATAINSVNYTVLPISLEAMQQCDMHKVYSQDAKQNMISSGDISVQDKGQCFEVDIIDASIHSVNGELLDTPFKAQTDFSGLNSNLMSITVRSKRTGETLDEIQVKQGFFHNIFYASPIEEFFILKDVLVIVRDGNAYFLNKQSGQFCHTSLQLAANHRLVFVKYKQQYYVADPQNVSFNKDISHNLSHMNENISQYLLRKVDFHQMCEW
jgi:hypothetical protein